MQEYENDRWRIVSGKVGNGFSATACKEKAIEIEGQEESADRTTGRRRGSEAV